MRKLIIITLIALLGCKSQIQTKQDTQLSEYKTPIWDLNYYMDSMYLILNPPGSVYVENNISSKDSGMIGCQRFKESESKIQLQDSLVMYSGLLLDSLAPVQIEDKEYEQKLKKYLGSKVKTKLVRCDCPCHQTPGMMHIISCCHNGFIEIEK